VHIRWMVVARRRGTAQFAGTNVVAPSQIVL